MLLCGMDSQKWRGEVLIVKKAIVVEVPKFCGVFALATDWASRVQPWLQNQPASTQCEVTAFLGFKITSV